TALPVAQRALLTPGGRSWPCCAGKPRRRGTGWVRRLRPCRREDDDRPPPRSPPWSWRLVGLRSGQQAVTGGHPFERFRHHRALALAQQSGEVLLDAGQVDRSCPPELGLASRGEHGEGGPPVLLGRDALDEPLLYEFVDQ